MSLELIFRVYYCRFIGSLDVDNILPPTTEVPSIVEYIWELTYDEEYYVCIGLVSYYWKIWENFNFLRALYLKLIGT